MSLVIYYAGKLYGDTKAWAGEGNVPSPGSKNKVVRADNGDLLGITSATLGQPYKALRTYNDGYEFLKDGEFKCIIVKRGEKGYYYWADDSTICGPFFNKFYAIGSGSKFALGVLRQGGTVRDAYRIAAEYDYFTDSKFRTYNPED